MAATTVQSNAVKAGLMPDHTVPATIVLSRTGTYTATAALDANSVIQLVPIPLGAQILDIIVQCTALGAGRTLDIGDDGDIDRFFDGLSGVTAAISRFGSQMGGVTVNTAGNVVHGASALGYEYTADNTIDAKVLGDTFPAAAVITMTVLYKMQGGVADET